MPRCCFVPKCKSGLASARKGNNAARPSFFQPPKDEELFRKWARAIPRKDRPLTHKDSVCSLHFPEDQVVKFFMHKINGEEVKIERGRPTLEADAVPCIFPNLPAYYTKIPRRRKTRVIPSSLPTTAASRSAGKHVTGINAPAMKLQCTTHNYPTSTLCSIIENIKDISLPSVLWGYHINSANTTVAFSRAVDSPETLLIVDRIVAIDNSLSVKLIGRGKEVPLPPGCIDKVREMHQVELILNCVDGLHLCQGATASVNQPECQHSKSNTEEPLFSKHCRIFIDKTKIAYFTRDSCTKCYLLYKVSVKRCTAAAVTAQLKEHTRRTLQQNNRRLVKKVQDLQKEVKALKDDCAKKVDVSELMEGFSANQRNTVQAFLDGSKRKGPTGHRYSREWMYQCLLMRDKGPRLYKYLREKDILPLPSHKSLQRYSSSLNGGCGFQEGLVLVWDDRVTHAEGEQRSVITELNPSPGLSLHNNSAESVGDAEEDSNEMNNHD